MIKKETAERRTEELLKPFLEEKQFELVDVEFVKEGSDQILRVLLDKEGGIRIDDCELTSRFLSKALDEADFIDAAYMLEVSSPGLLRPFKKDRDYERALGKEVEIHLYKSLEGQKEWIGLLEAFDRDTVSILLDEDAPLKVKRADISLIRNYIDFSDL